MDEAKLNLRLLRMLARIWGIGTSYLDYENNRVVIDVDVLARLISSLSEHPISRETKPERLLELLQLRKKELTEEILPRTLVAWDGRIPFLWAWLPADTENLAVTLHSEDKTFTADLPCGAPLRRRLIDGVEYKRVKLSWDRDIPYGYYALRLANAPSPRLLISAPLKLTSSPPRWGFFSPLYALHSQKKEAIGNYSLLLRAGEETKRQGGDFFGTLPLLPVAYDADEPKVSPYSPLSRFFWNELFLDTENLPGGYRPEDTLQGEGEYVDYEDVYARKKKVLAEAAADFFDNGVTEGFRSYVDGHSYLKDYARFRAGNNEKLYRYHLYTQYACHLQLSEIRKRAEEGRCAQLYLDYTVGVDPEGFDAQKMADVFLKGYFVGAPPDQMFNQGQNWGLEPLHPRRLEESGYAYLRACLHHYLSYAKIIRLDHIMALARLYCIPEGRKPSEGTYVYYRLEHQMAVLCLEAWRHQATIIGEDLGTVPLAIQESMTRHEIGRMWIAQFNLNRNLKKMFRTITPAMIACVNTHDMMPFSAFLQGEDAKLLAEMGFVDKKQAEKMARDRKNQTKMFSDYREAFLTIIEGMAKSPARLVMVNLEDLWEETRPQNLPGTSREFPNWRLRLKYPIEEWSCVPLFQPAVQILNRYRKCAADVE